MKWVKKYFSNHRVLGVILIAIGIYAGYWRFYKLAPLYQYVDVEWIKTHSKSEYWNEVKESVKRLGRWEHDDAWTFGCYGNKDWAEWVINHSSGEMGCMEGGSPTHGVLTMKLITNQTVEGVQSEGWREWWEENKLKTQEQWIIDGFNKKGFNIHTPITSDQFPLLLKMLGNNILTYNAFRCLRDSNFNPVEFAISNDNISKGITSGLLKYAEFEKQHPVSDGLGILFAVEEDFRYGEPLPIMLTLESQVFVYSIIFGLPLIGIILLLYAIRKKHYESRKQELF